jgi:hypothetical protein
MGGAIRCKIEPGDGPAVQSAATWIERFYPDVTASCEAGKVRLASVDRGETELRLIWIAILANEKLLARGAARRAAAIEALVR